MESIYVHYAYEQGSRVFELSLPNLDNLDVLFRQTSGGQDYYWYSDECTDVGSMRLTGTRIEGDQMIKSYVLNRYSNQKYWDFPAFYIRPASGVDLQGQKVSLTQYLQERLRTRTLDLYDGDVHISSLIHEFPADYYLPLGQAFYLAQAEEGLTRYSVNPTYIDWLIPRDKVVDVSSVTSCANRTNSVLGVNAILPADIEPGQKITLTVLFDDAFIFKTISHDSYLLIRVGERLVKAALVRPTNWQDMEFSSLNFELTLEANWVTEALAYASSDALQLGGTQLKSVAPLDTTLPEPGESGSLSPLGITFDLGPLNPILQYVSAQEIAGAGVSKRLPQVVVNSNQDHELKWLVTFDKPVGNVSIEDFTVLTTGSASAVLSRVEAAQNTLLQMRKNLDDPVYQASYYIYANQIFGEGLLELGLAQENDIIARDGLALAAAEQLTQQSEYLLLSSPPRLLHNEFTIESGNDYRETVYFSQEITGLDRSDFEQQSYIELNETYDTYTWYLSPQADRYDYLFQLTGNTSGFANFRSRLTSSNDIRNLAGIYMDGSTDGSGSVDTVFPEIVSIMPMDSLVTNSDQVSFEIVLSEPVILAANDFTIANSDNDFDITNLTVSATGANDSYILTFSGYEGEGELSIGRTPGSRGTIDLAGNILTSGQTLSSETYTIDTTNPVVTAISRIGPEQTNLSTLTFDVAFSEVVVGVDATDFEILLDEGMTAQISSVSGSDNSYQVIVDISSGTGSVGLSVPSNASVQDEATNSLEEAYLSGENYLYIVNPYVNISNNSSGVVAGEVIFTFDFSEAVTGFDIDDIEVSGGTKGMFIIVSDTQYTLTVTPFDNSATDLTIDIADSVATNASGYGNAGTQSNIAVDTIAPSSPILTLQVDTGASATDQITTDGTVIIGGIEEGAHWEYSTNAGNNWFEGGGNSFDITPAIYLANDILVRQTDIAGNVSENGAFEASVIVDVTNPVATLFTITNNPASSIETDAYPEGNIKEMQTAALGDSGDFVVVWLGQELLRTNSPPFVQIDQSVYVQKFDRNRNVLSPQIKLAATWPYPPNLKDSNLQVTALGSSGEFVVTWTGLDINGYQSVFVQRFDAEGIKAGALVTQQCVENIFSSSVLELNDGAFVVSWRDNVDVCIQRFNSDGTKATDDPIVLDMLSSSLARTNDAGAFVVAGSVPDPDCMYCLNESLVGIQRFDEDGNKLGSLTTFNADGADGDNFSVTATALSEGGFLVSWNALYSSPSPAYRGHLQRFDADGTSFGIVEVKANDIESDEFYLSVAALGNDGSFVLTGNSYQVSDGSNRVYIQKFDKFFNKVGVATQLEGNGTTDFKVTEIGSSGDYALLWSGSNNDQTSSDIYTQRFNADGTKLGDTLQVIASEDAALLNFKPTMMIQKDNGEAVVAWIGGVVSSVGDTNIYLQQLNADGSLKAPTGPGGTPSAQSSEQGGAYLVNAVVSVADVSDITSANSNQWTFNAINTADSGINMDVSNLVDGVYYLFTVDLAGNLSAVSEDSFTISSTSP